MVRCVSGQLSGWSGEWVVRCVTMSTFCTVMLNSGAHRVQRIIIHRATGVYNRGDFH